MATTSPQSERLITLDVVRGIAVMGIFSVNVVGMAMIEGAYFYPPAYGFESLADRVMWFLNFLLVDGKMRSLFSILFGASMLLVIERAASAGRSPARTHYARMVVLLLVGFLHFCLLWWGDILAHYAAVGMVAFLFWKRRARTLLILALLGFSIYSAGNIYFFTTETAGYYQAQEPDAPAELRKEWEDRAKHRFPTPEQIAEDRAEHRNIATRFDAAVPEQLMRPLLPGPLWFETLSLMLLGMAGYKSGFFTGSWSDRSYRKVAAVALGASLAVYGILAIWVWRSGFGQIEMDGARGIWTPPFRPLAAMGYAALIILAFRNANAIRDRFAAVGRAAFTNYIGCTIIGTFVFFGFAGDLYGKLSRGEAWLLVPPVWALMLLWSKPWLDRFNYGPFEWVWRSLSRLELQPMRKGPAKPAEPVPA